MKLNTLSPASGSKSPRKRVGRGMGSGSGKTAGRGLNGQKARSGGYHKIGFEGGQMPLQRRLPKRGFRSTSPNATAEVRLHELEKIDTKIIDLASLKAARVINDTAKRAKVIASGKIEKSVTLKGIAVTKGAREAITQAGGKIED